MSATLRCAKFVLVSLIALESLAVVLLLIATLVCKSFLASNSFVASSGHYMCFFASFAAGGASPIVYMLTCRRRLLCLFCDLDGSRI